MRLSSGDEEFKAALHKLREAASAEYEQVLATHAPDSESTRVPYRLASLTPTGSDLFDFMTGHDFVRGQLEERAVLSMYRKLVSQLHPDKNPGVDSSLIERLTNARRTHDLETIVQIAFESGEGSSVDSDDMYRRSISRVSGSIDRIRGLIGRLLAAAGGADRTAIVRESIAAIKTITKAVELRTARRRGTP